MHGRCRCLQKRAAFTSNEDRRTLARLGHLRGIEHHKSEITARGGRLGAVTASCCFTSMHDRLPPSNARLPASDPGWPLSACKRAGRNSSRARLAVSLSYYFIYTHEVRIGRIGQRHVSSPDIALSVVRRSYTCRFFHSYSIHSSSGLAKQ